MFKYTDKYIPVYSILPIVAMITLNMITYFGSRIFTVSQLHHNMGIILDERIPLVPAFIIIYILAYIQWIIGYLMICRESKACCYWMITAEMIAKISCLFLFLLYPTTIHRPDIGGTDLCSILTAFVYKIDRPDNLFPSIHCLESWFCFRGAMYLKKLPDWYMPSMGVFTILVFLSTIFTKQHVVVDIFGAIVVAEVAIWLAAKIFPAMAVDVKKNFKFK